MMKVNLKQIPSDGRPLQVKANLDLSDLSRWGGCPLPQPVDVEAVFAVKNGIVTLNYKADYTVEGACGRCLAPVKLALEEEFSHILAEQAELGDNDDFIPAPDAQLDLDELVRADISLGLAGTLLCGEDCRGLCPICGTDKNTGDCTCNPHTPDPRFAALRALLEEDSQQS